MTTSPDAGDDLLRILDDLDQLITGARSVPMSGSAIVNREEALTLIEHARHAVPSAVRHAEEIVADADEVLAQGREEAERIVLRAQEEAERLVAGESVVRMAHERADEIIAAAEDRAAGPSGSSTEHVVGPGDSLWSITATALGPGATDEQIVRAWPLVYETNAERIGADPSLIHPGDALELPDALAQARARSVDDD